MNAGGVSKACKSNAYGASCTSGKRERNTLVTCLEVRNNSAKAVLIPDVPNRYFLLCKDLSLREGLMVYQLVGEVMAHQGYDGYRV